MACGVAGAVQCNEKVGVIFTGASKKVFLGVPTSCFTKTLGLKVGCYWPLKGFWKTKGKQTGRSGEKISFILRSKKSLFPSLYISKFISFLNIYMQFVLRKVVK